MVIFKDMEVLKALDSLKASEILPMASLLLENTVPLLCVCVCVCACVCARAYKQQGVFWERRKEQAGKSFRKYWKLGVILRHTYKGEFH